MSGATPLLLGILLIPLAGAILNGTLTLIASRTQKTPPRALSTTIALLGSGASFILALTLFISGFLETETTRYASGPLFTWISTGAFRADFGLVVDSLSMTLLLLITGIGSLIHLYSTGYMKEDPAYSRYFTYLNLFLFFMLLLVMGDNLLTLFVGWEGVGLSSYLLIGFWYRDADKALAGKKAFIVNRIGDFGFLIGIFLIYSALSGHPETAGVSLLNFDVLREHAFYLAPIATIAAIALFIGATGKSAQIPLYVWLPDAMAGPTPVSALIHAATMVTAGVYMMTRLFFLFEMSPVALQVVATTGAATALFAASIGLVQTDIKKVLAYSTVSQLGYMVLGVGVGAPFAAVFHLFTHAFFKACLFLGAGSVIHAMHHEQDIRKMGGLRHHMPITFITFLLSTLAIAGIPPFSGFFSKDEILWKTWEHGHVVLYGMGLAAAGMTAFYMFRLTALTFLGKSRIDPHTAHHLHESPAVMTLPLVILAGFATLVGFLGVPEAFGGHNLFHHFLSSIVPSQGFEALYPSTEHAEALTEFSTEQLFAGLSALWAALFSGAALYLYVKKPEWPSAWANRFSRLHHVLSAKYYIDELYDLIVVRPLAFISNRILFQIADLKLIDGGLIGLWPALARTSNRALSFLQSGQIATLAFYMVLGALLVLGVLSKG